MLQFNYNKAIQQVAELRSIANDMEASKKLSNAMSTTGAAWEGPTSEQFKSKCEALSDLITAEIGRIRTIADSLEQTAKQIRDTELQAQQTLKTNTIRS